MKIIEKPWGKEHIICHTKKYAGKFLQIDKGQRLSLQFHNKKDETLYLIRGVAKISVNGEERLISNNGNVFKGKTIDILHGTKHRIEAVEPCIFIEFSTHELDDVIRIEDDYERVKND